MKKLQLIHEFDPSQYSVAYKTLLDFQEFGKVHPVMTSVKIIGEKNGNIEYRVKERTNLFGFIPMRPGYNATVTEVEKGKLIRYDSQVKKNVKLEIVFSFEEHSTTVKEDITITSNKLVARIFMGILKKMHLQVMQNIRDSKIKKNQL